jgi:hypothetical protein
MANSQALRPAAGLFAAPRRIDAVADLFANIWQCGYVTTDLERAIEVISGRFGFEHCMRLPVGGATFLAGSEEREWDARFAMGSRGSLIIELIEPLGGEVEFYRRFLPDDGSFAIRFHHFGAFVPVGDEEWERVRAILADAGYGYDYTVLIPGRVRAGYVDTSAELGHLLEICQLQREDTDFFSGLALESA